MITFNRVMIKAPKGAHSFLLAFFRERMRKKGKNQEGDEREETVRTGWYGKNGYCTSVHSSSFTSSLRTHPFSMSKYLRSK